jgi:hypothetical protein
MALMAMLLAHGDLTMNHLVSEKWSCLAMPEKARVKSRDSSAKFHWSHFREINTLESRACTFADAASGEHRKSYPRQRHLLAKSGMVTTLIPPLKHIGFQEESRSFLTIGSRSIKSLTLPKILMKK